MYSWLESRKEWKMNYAVIMAGGTGKRLWPLSRQKRPKQVLKLLDGQTLLSRCFERLCPASSTCAISSC